MRAGPGTWAGRSRLLQSGGDDDWPHVSPWGNCEGGREGGRGARGKHMASGRASERAGHTHANANAASESAVSLAWKRNLRPH